MPAHDLKPFTGLPTDDIKYVLDFIGGVKPNLREHDNPLLECYFTPFAPPAENPQDKPFRQHKGQICIPIAVGYLPALVLGRTFQNQRPLPLEKWADTRADVQKVADKVGRHAATVYRWLDSYEQSGLVSSLLRKPRSDKGNTRIVAEVETIIKQTIEDFHLTQQRRTPAKTAAEVESLSSIIGVSGDTQDASTIMR